MRTYAEETKVRLAAKDDGEEQLADLVPKPVFRYSDEPTTDPGWDVMGNANSLEIHRKAAAGAGSTFQRGEMSVRERRHLDNRACGHHSRLDAATVIDNR